MTADLLPAPAQVRIARTTHRLAEQRRFYGETLGLVVVAEFSGHAGYSGVVFALPGLPLHLEFTQHLPAAPVPDPDELLVLYLPDAGVRRALLRRLAAAGRRPLEPANPYWKQDAHTFADADGRRVVLAARRLRIGSVSPDAN